MKKIVFIIFVLTAIIILSGCAKKEVVKVTCNEPYILVGVSCCLDKNDNKICDKDEVKEEPKVEVKEEPEEEGKEDKCGNELCDEGEDCESCQKDCGKCFSLSDLQADINKVIDWKTVLKKEKEDNVANYYVYSELKGRLLGKYPSKGEEDRKPTETYYKVLPKRYILVSQIKDKQNYIEDSNEFYQYIVENKDYILYPIKEAKDNFQREFKDGKIAEIMFGYKVGEYKFVNISSTDEKIFFDNITQMETVGNKIVEIVFVSTESYEANYQKEGYKYLKNLEFSGINYEQIVSVYCSPSLIITLYPHNSYNKDDYDNFQVDTSYFFNDIRHDRKDMLVDATALVSMCEQRYEFTYLRYR